MANGKKFLLSSRISALSKPIKNIEHARRQFMVDPIKIVPKLLEDVENDLTNAARVDGKFDKDKYFVLLDKYASLPIESSDNPTGLVADVFYDLFGGVPLWRSPNLQYNLGAAVNRVSSALYSLALDLNIFNINDALSGNAIIAEHAVVRVLSDLTGVDYKKTCGFFTFGGTATNLYAIKLAIAKNFPNARQNGVPHNIKIAVTEDSHFSHMNALNWLGVGVKNALVIKANKDRRSSLKDAKRKIELAIKNGKKIPVIVVNGGTTYDNVVDDIEGFVLLRDGLVKKYNLDYVPQIHVDSVIGWVWLMFKDYDFDANALCIEFETLKVIKKQYERIAKVGMADTWGVDFHKGPGSCPVPCSLIMINNNSDAKALSYSKKIDMHQLANEFNEFSPVDYTLETSRPAGSALAALGAIHALGQSGYQAHLANLIQQSQLLRQLIIEKSSDILILNEDSLGYATMIRLYPPHLAKTRKNETSVLCNASIKYTQKVNKYNKLFFKFDTDTRINKLSGVEYSFSSKYISSSSGETMCALKFYPTSPYITARHICDAVDVLIKQKFFFDSNLIKMD